MPMVPATQAIKHKTPYGASCITRWAIFSTASAAAAKTLPTAFVFSPPMMIPIPNKMEKKIIGNTSPLANEDIGFMGTIPNNLSATLVDATPAVMGSTPVRSMPCPG